MCGSVATRPGHIADGTRMDVGHEPGTSGARSRAQAGHEPGTSHPRADNANRPRLPVRSLGNAVFGRAGVGADASSPADAAGGVWRGMCSRAALGRELSASQQQEAYSPDLARLNCCTSIGSTRADAPRTRVPRCRRRVIRSRGVILKGGQGCQSTTSALPC
jgi:hypothetical protein